MTCLQAQPVENRADAFARNRVRADDEHRVELFRVGQVQVGHHADAVARTYVVAVGADQLILVDGPLDQHVRDPQRINCRAERDERKVVQQQKPIAGDAEIMQTRIDTIVRTFHFSPVDSHRRRVAKRALIRLQFVGDDVSLSFVKSRQPPSKVKRGKTDCDADERGEPR
ncbi:conserved hypothetical protein, partial [Ricinus communis]